MKNLHAQECRLDLKCISLYYKSTPSYGSAELGFQDYAFLTLTARNDWFSTLSLAGKDAPNNDLYTSRLSLGFNFN